jgi:hypothetical protein
MEAAFTASPVIGPVTNWSSSSLGIFGSAALLAAMAAFFVFVWLGINGPVGHVYASNSKFRTGSNGVIMRAHWATRPITPIAPDLLIGDKPLIQDGILQDSFLLASPISPRHLFFAFNEVGTWDNLVKKSAKHLARETNKGIVTQAERYVYSTGSHHVPLIRKYLARP